MFCFHVNASPSDAPRNEYYLQPSDTGEFDRITKCRDFWHTKQPSNHQFGRLIEFAVLHFLAGSCDLVATLGRRTGDNK